MWAKGDICQERDVISTEGVLLAQQVFLAIHTEAGKALSVKHQALHLYV